jgi:5-methylcytosine-specific restriction endonuclease McrA
MTRSRATDVREGARELFWHLHDQERYRCPGCGRSRDETVAMHVHHRDGNPANNRRQNLIALCNQCHLHGEHGLNVGAPTVTSPSGRTARPTGSVSRPGP